MSVCDYCSKEAVERVKIEDAQLGNAVRTKDGESLGRPVVRPAIYAQVCQGHVGPVREQVRQTELRLANKRSEAAKRAAITRKLRKAQGTLF